MTNEKMTVMLSIMKRLNLITHEDGEIQGKEYVFYVIKDLDKYNVEELREIDEAVKHCIKHFDPTTVLTMIKDNAMWRK